MGRPPWATSDQVEFLESFVPNLDREKKGNGLTPYYNQISQAFLQQWPVEPSTEERNSTTDEAKRQEIADARRTKVSHCFVRSFERELIIVTSKSTSGTKRTAN